MKYLGKHKVFDDLMIGGVLLTPPDPLSYAYELILPNDDGSAGQVLTTDGNGLLTWTTNGSGTVTSVDVSGGSTGLTTSGGPITSSGTITIGGTLAVGSGGTGLGTVGNNEILTGNGTSALTSESTLTYDGQRLSHTMTPSGGFSGYVITANTAVGWASGNNIGHGIVNTLNKDENTDALGTNTYTSIVNDINDTATNNRNLTQLIGVSNQINFANDAPSGNVMAWGTINSITNGDSQFGVKNTLTGGGTPATTYGIYQTVDDGGYDLYFLSSDATTVDYFSLATKASGETDITTVDGGGASAHLNFNIDGNITLNADSGTVDFKDDTAYLARIDTNGLSFQNNTGAGIKFEGATDNANQTTLSVIDPTGTRAVNLPDASGTLALKSEIPTDTVTTGAHIHTQTKVTLDPTACNGLNSSPVTLVAAQGADTIIVPVSVTVLLDRNSADTSGADLIVGYNSTTNYQYAIRYMRRFMLGITTDMQFNMVPYFNGHGANSLTGGTNVPLTMSTSAPITAGSLTSMVVYTSYYVIDK